MKKIIIAGAGGAPSEGVIKSLLKSKRPEEIIGMGSEPTDLALSAASKKYYISYANQPGYKAALESIVKKEKPDLIHFQNDLEIYHASLLRNEIEGLAEKVFMPTHEVIDTCVHKYKTWQCFKAAGITVPENHVIATEKDLQFAFNNLADADGRIWLRASSIGGGGKGALPTADIDFAKAWINHYKGWGEFVAAQMLTSKTVTWLSIWNNGKLIVAQSRAREAWTHGNRTLSGVTGVTKVGKTVSDIHVDETAQRAIMAVDKVPHGIYGVDMTYDRDGIPNPTEINISRFFTTVLFFTEAGLNMPEIFKDIALYNELPSLEKVINPLPDNLLWLRGMDTTPRLMKQDQMEDEIILSTS
jgi:carbamoyl-phosphate synthase large subunit